MKLIFEQEAHFDCHGCGKCCRTPWKIPVEPTKSERLRDLGPPLAVTNDQLGRNGENCIFLQSDSSCKVHARLGPAAKPNACLLFPFVVTPTPEGLHVGVSYFCPSVRESRGRVISEHEEELQATLAELDFGPPSDVTILSSTEPLGWGVYQILEEALLKNLGSDPVSALLKLHFSLTTLERWWNYETDVLFGELDESTSQQVKTRAQSLARKLNLQTEEASSSNLPNRYIKSLIQRKYLRRGEFINELLTLASIATLISEATNTDIVLDKLELLITHESGGRALADQLYS